jgi:hypothetical protein
MTEQTDEKEPVRPWHWPRQWVRDQSFYRDIATRTVAGVLVVAIAYVFGVIMGTYRARDCGKASPLSSAPLVT